jgi:hypothetical protein
MRLASVLVSLHLAEHEASFYSLPPVKLECLIIKRSSTSTVLDLLLS